MQLVRRAWDRMLRPRLPRNLMAGVPSPSWSPKTPSPSFFVLCFILVISVRIPAKAVNQNESYQSEAYVLMEASTGTIIDSKNPDKQLRPASITKIMTAQIALEKGNLDNYMMV